MLAVSMFKGELSAWLSILTISSKKYLYKKFIFKVKLMKTILNFKSHY